MLNPNKESNSISGSLKKPPSENANSAELPYLTSKRHELVYTEQVKQLYNNGPHSFMAIIILASFMLYVFWDKVSTSVILIWYSIIVISSVIRIVYTYRVRGDDPDYQQAKTRFNIYFTGLVISNLVWGLSAFMFYIPGSIVHQAFLAFVLGGVMAGTMVTYAPILKAVLVGILLSVIPLGVLFITEGDIIHFSMGMMIVVFVVIFAILSIRINKTIIQSLQFRFENIELIHNLQTSNELSRRFNRELKIRETHLAKIQKIAHLGNWEWDTVSDQHAWSDEMYRIFGIDSSSITITHPMFMSFIHPEDAGTLAKALKLSIKDKSSFQIEVRVIHSVGSERYIQFHGEVQHGSASTPIIFGTAIDVTEKHMAERDHQLALTVFENTHEAILITDLGGIIQTANHAFTVLTGFSAKEIVNKSLDLFLVDINKNEDFYLTIKKELLKKEHWAGEIWYRRKDGETFPLWLSVSRVKDNTGKITQFVVIAHDISGRKQYEELIAYKAYHDPLTGLPNRDLLQDRLTHNLARCKRLKLNLAILFIDLDGFKPVNDQHGHQVGDILLQHIATEITKQVREEDTVARIGGDEFIVLLSQIAHPEDTVLVSEKILSIFKKAVQVEDISLQITASVGISIFPDHGEEAQDLLHKADKAMYQVKHSGKNNFQIYSDSPVE